MKIEYRKAKIADAELLIGIYNSAFYDDYVRYGECPAYGKTREMMERSIMDYPKFIISCDSEPVGCVSCKKVETGIYEVGCLCVVPKYQGKGIGTQAIRFIASYYEDWSKITLVTPMDKTILSKNLPARDLTGRFNYCCYNSSLSITAMPSWSLSGATRA